MNVSIDSRTIKPGEYFIPVQGKRFDGRDFIPEVLEKGAHVLDVDLCSYAKKYRKTLNAKVVAVVGSAGKTTVKDMLYGVLSTSYRVVKTRENQNNEFGVPLTILAADSDTEILIVEMGLRKKDDIVLLAKLVQPDVVVFTGVGMSHMSFFDSVLQLANAKAAVFRKALSWQRGARTAFICTTGVYHERVYAKARGAGYQVMTYSGDDKVSENIDVCYQVGRFFDVAPDFIQTGIASFTGSAHRMTVMTRAGVTILDDTYNANPSGVQYALQYLKRYTGRKIVVLGDMLELGSCSLEQHQQVAQWALNEEVDLLLLYGEEVRVIPPVSRVSALHFSDKTQLSSMLRDEIKEGDVVLVKGSRQLQMETIVEDIVRVLS